MIKEQVSVLDRQILAYAAFFVVVMVVVIVLFFHLLYPSARRRHADSLLHATAEGILSPKLF